MFRTATGQTGEDAYAFEVAAIANAQRALDNRFKRLRAVIAEERPDLFDYSTDYMFVGANAAASFREYLKARV